MRICDVTQFYSPFGGGVRRYLEEKRAHVRDRTGDEHVLIVPGERDAEVVEADGRLRLITLRAPLVNRTARYRWLVGTRRLREALQRVRPDIVEAGDPYHVAWVAEREARRVGAAPVAFYHSHFPDAYLRTAGRFCGPVIQDAVYAWAQGYVERLYSRFDRVFVCGARLRPLLRSWGVRGVVPVRLGVDTAVFRPGPRDDELRVRAGVPPGAFLLLYVGRLCGEKNTPALVDAFRRLRLEGGREWWLAVLGQGVMAGRIEGLAAETRAVVWRPAAAGKEEVARWYRAADLVVHPSVNETFGLVSLEAQACGRLVAGIRGSAMEEHIFEGLEDWSRVDAGAGLAEAVRRLAGRAGEAAGARVAARARAEYSWDAVLRGLWEHYRAVRAAGGGRPSPGGAV